MGFVIVFSALRAVAFATWLLMRPVLGWMFIVVGLIGMPMPIVNGLIFLLIGLALVGPRNRIVRWSRVHVKLLLDRWAGLQTPLVGPLGRLAQRSAQQVSKQHRRLRWWWMERQARRRSLAPDPSRNVGG